MLVLSRKVGETISIGGNVTVVVHRVTKGRVTIGIQAPSDIAVLRGELAPFGIEGDAGAEAEEGVAADEEPPHCGPTGAGVTKRGGNREAPPVRRERLNATPRRPKASTTAK